ncbi:MAG: NAD-dependent epimerase/dehydratase family protein, partial [Ignavibacteriota bacterium]
MAYQRDYNINTRIVRIFNSYGSRMKLKNGCSIPVFFSQALNNQPAIVFSDGNQTYSFIYIYDQLDGILNLLFSDGKEPVNIGNSEEITVKKMAGEIISLTNSKTKIVYEPLPIDNSQVRHP